QSRTIDRLPLVLFDGRTADAAYPGWHRDPFGHTAVRAANSFATGYEAYLKYVTSTGVTFVTMDSDLGPCRSQATRGYLCAPAGELPTGQLRTYTRVAPYGSYPHEAQFLVLAYPDGSGVSVNVGLPPSRPGGPAAIGAARQVLADLVRVDRATFEERTASTLTLQ
ncbi:MAG: hypothetical protein ACXV2J_00185, partial [Actinomycetes bacterium]